MDARALMNHIENTYQITPDYLWEKFPDYAAFRHRRSKKWFALLAPVPRAKMGLEGDGLIPLLNVKLDPEMVNELLETGDFLPAYHMNKTHWLSIPIEDTDTSVIENMLADSYDLTKN